MIWESILIALSLCADCFAVSLCSSVSYKKPDWKTIGAAALTFALIQTGLLAAGWGLGDLLLGVVGNFARILAFLLLLYVGGSLLRDGLVGKMECQDLRSFKYLIMAGIATSIDAAAVGVAKSFETMREGEFLSLGLSVFVITVASVCAGMFGGSRLGMRFGKWARIFGGLVLLAIAFWNLFR